MGYLIKKQPKKFHLGIFSILLVIFCILPCGKFSTLQASPFPEDDLEVRRDAAVSIIYDQQMDFGQLALSDGSVTLGLSDSIINDPDIIYYGGSAYSGIFTITGDLGVAVDVSIVAIPSNGLTLSSFVSSEGNMPLTGVLLSPTTGELVLTLGATLTVDRMQASVGSGQTISFTITSTYN
jgi:hypothetical protein